MNKEIIKIALKSDKGSSFRTSCHVSDNNSYAPRILSIMTKGYTLLYASSIIHSIRKICNESLKYDEFVALCCFSGISQDKILACRDTSYFKPQNGGKSYEILIRLDFAHSLVCSLGYGKDKVKKIFGYARSFSPEHYTKYIEMFEKKKLDNEIKNRKFCEEITILPQKYEPTEFHEGELPYHQLMKERVENLKINATEAELHFKSVLESNGIEYIFQNPCIVKGRVCIMDFFLPKHRICIEIDGGYHMSTEQLISDKARDHSMALCGILTIRFTNEEVMSNSAIQDLNPVLGMKYYNL